MTESRDTYLRRVLPDIRLIEGDIIDAARPDRRESDFALVNAIARVTKLREDLERAYVATV
jgi:hypothetical protein